MPKQWHKRGCGNTTWTEKCPRCNGYGYKSALGGLTRLTCSQCDGKGIVCSSCKKAY